MIEDHDPRLQRLFDERLLRVLPPARTPRRRSVGLAGVALAVLFSTGGLAFAADVNGTADAAGLSCTDVLKKVEIWFESVKNGTTDEQVTFKTRVAKLVGETCDARGSKDPNNPVVPASEPIKPESPMTPECLAAQERAKEMAATASTMTRAQELELKERINAMPAAPCAAK